MTVSAPRPAALILLPLALAALVGCAPTAPATDTGSGAEPAAPAASGACPTVEGYELFSSDLIAAAPAEGFEYVAGTPIEWTLAIGAGYTPTMSISYINEAGDAIPEGDYNLLDRGDGTYYQDLGIFNSDASGRPGFASVTLVNDGSFTPPAGQESFDISTIGIYCVTFG